MISSWGRLTFRSARSVARPEGLWNSHVLQQRMSASGRGQPTAGRALKGTGDPTIMRRLVVIMDADDDDVDDDFLAEDSSASSKEQPSPRKTAQPDPNNPKHVNVRTSQYISSSTKLETCPQDGRPEFAIIGRSNVGKSSLINMMTRNKNLALTSKQPGKTKCINHFLINGSWYLVDLPGYGYAKSSQKSRMDWNNFTKKFFLERETLLCVMLLVDASIPPQQVDLECADWLTSAEVPYIVVFTKADKTKRGGTAVEDNVAAFLDAIQAHVGALPESFLTSSQSGTGGQDLLRELAALREAWLAAVGKPTKKTSPLLMQAEG